MEKVTKLVPNPLVVTFQRQFDGFGQLIGTGGAFEAAADAFQLGDDIFCFHAFHQCGDTLCVAVTTAIELHVLDDAVLDIKLDGLAACALCSVSVFHI